MNALVTGTSRGIGRAVARRLAAEGAFVLCHARDADAAQELAAELGGVALSGDLASEAAIASIGAEVAAAVPALDVLVHNAAVNPRPDERLDEVDRETYRQVHAVNVEAPLFLTQALLAPLRAAGAARVVLVSSEAGQFSNGMGSTGLSYRMSKAALNAFALVAAQALRDDGIRVNAVHPGWVRTDMGGPNADLAIEQGAERVIEVALGDGFPSGTFVDAGAVAGW